MQIFKANPENKYCGFWNNSPIEIGMVHLSSIPKAEALHSHAFREYYIVIDGRAKLLVDNEEHFLEPGTITMVEPHERHKLVWLHPEKGVHWVIIKEKSAPDGKIVH